MILIFLVVLLCDFGLFYYNIFNITIGLIYFLLSLLLQNHSSNTFFSSSGFNLIFIFYFMYQIYFS